MVSVSNTRQVVLNLVILKPDVIKKATDSAELYAFASELATRKGITFHGIVIFALPASPQTNEPALAFSGGNMDVATAADEIVEKYGLGIHGEGYYVTINPYTSQTNERLPSGALYY
jgi:hypothetical protein